MFKPPHRVAKKLPVHHKEEHQNISAMQRQVNRLFDDFFHSPMLTGFSDMPLSVDQIWGDVSPRVDMSETDKEVLVKVELPGMTEKDVELSINHEFLTISGEKKQEKEHSEKGWYRMERQYGSFSRSIALPHEIDADNAEADFKHGLLVIKLPKAVVAEMPSKVIKVK